MCLFHDLMSSFIFRKPASNRSPRDRGNVFSQDQKKTHFLFFYQCDKKYDILPLEHPDGDDDLSKKEKLELVEGQTISLYHQGNEYEDLMLRKVSLEKGTKKRQSCPKTGQKQSGCVR